MITDTYLANQEEVINELLTVNTLISLLNGKNGSGKSFVCNELNIKWKGIEENVAFLLRNSISSFSMPYAPFLFAISSTHQGYSISKIATDMIVSSSADIPLVGNTISGLLSSLLKKEEKSILTESAITICSIIEHFAKNKNVLFICDDFSEWDEESKLLIFHLIKGNLPFKFLRKSRFILSSDKELPDLQFLIENPNNVCKCTLNDIDYEKDFTRALAIFGYSNSLTNKDSYEYFKITNGNLELVKQLVFILKSPENSVLNRQSLQLFDILENRIYASSKCPLPVSSFFKRASVIGQKFNASIGKLFCSDIEYNFDRLLNEGMLLNFINIERENVKFSNEMIFNAYSQYVKSHEKQLHIKFVELLNTLQPSNYEAKAFHLYLGEEYKDSAVQYTLFLIFYYRETGKKFPLQNNHMLTLLKEYELFEYLEKIHEAYSFFLNGEHLSSTECLMLLRQTNIQEITFEVEFLIAINYITLYQNQHFLYPQMLKLEAWFENQKFCDSNFEMWMRSGICLINYYMYFDKTNKLAETYKQIIQYCSDKVKTDTFIQDKLNILYAKSNMNFPVETAYYETKKSVDYFTSQNDDRINITKLYVSLVNHIGNCIILSKLEEAISMSKMAFKTINTFSCLHFPRTENLVNNFILCGVLSNKIELKIAKILFEKIINQSKKVADTLLIKNNYFVILCLLKDFNRAESIIEELLQDLNEFEENDAYYQYFILNNYMMFKLLYGKQDEAKNIWDNLKDLLPSSPDKSYFKRRNKLIQRLLENSEQLLFQNSNWNDYFLRKYPNQIGEAWSFWGKVMLLSELQTWADC
jgi:hypothetical protein